MELTCDIVSQRGVVFFRNQDIDIDQQKILGQKLGELTGKPESSKLHRHALSNSKRGIAVDENGRLDDEISVISSEVGLAKDRGMIMGS
jgi:alpha-ketoglutarate-dependent taurine dioxygenase